MSILFDLTDKSTTMESDSFFRHLDQDFFESTDGHVDAPTGWFGLLRVDASLRDAVGVASGDFVPASIDDGLYLVRVNDSGMVWALQADVEIGTRFVFNELVKEYTDWAAEGE